MKKDDIKAKDDTFNQSCISHINSHMVFLTNTEKKLGHYIIKDHKKVCNYTITELAEKSGTSEATIVRFCKNLGFKGYQEFKIRLARDIIPEQKQLNSTFEVGDDVETICKKVFSSIKSGLNKTLNVLDFKMLDEAAKLIYSGSRIAIFGSGGSNLVALDAQHKFLKVGISTQVGQDADIQSMIASLLTKDDVAIGISHSGSNKHLVHCMMLAHQQGAKTIALTTQGKSPLLKYSNIVLFSATQETAFKSESVSARIAQLAIIDALVASVAFKDYGLAAEAIQKTRNATSEGKY